MENILKNLKQADIQVLSTMSNSKNPTHYLKINDLINWFVLNKENCKNKERIDTFNDIVNSLVTFKMSLEK